MTIEKKLLGTSPSGGATDVADVFSADLYTGTNSTQTIINGIDLAGEGGIVWIKSRSDSGSNNLFYQNGSNIDLLKTNATDDASTNMGSYGTAFNSNGFSMGSPFSPNTVDMVAWTFRNKKKFFDIVTYTGNGVAGREISHGLAGPVGMMIIKATNATTQWSIWNKGEPSKKGIFLTNAFGDGKNHFGNGTITIAPTSSVFTVGTNNGVNTSGSTYIAYLFADNSSEDAEDQMIKCGSYTGTGANNTVVNLGWEPQFVLVKSSSNAASWMMMDTMRGMPTGGNTNTIRAESANTELTGDPFCEVTSTGFRPVGSDGRTNANNYTYIYMAIRAPMMVEPKAATDVFAAIAYTGNNTYDRKIGGAGFSPDTVMGRNINNSEGSNNYVGARLTGFMPTLNTDENAAENSTGPYASPDFMDGMQIRPSGDTNYLNGASSNNYISHMWKRSKGFMDVVAYKGTGNQPTNHKHSLGVVPELILVKVRDKAGENWVVMDTKTAAGFPSSGSVNTLGLNQTNASSETNIWHYTAPTDVHFTTNDNVLVNSSSYNYIVYLFATLAGISKCGSYIGNGSSQTISCGFSAGSRFVLIKRTDAAGDWYYWDSVRGIVAGNDPHLSLNTNAAQVTNDDSVDPHNSGFIVNQVSATNINVSSGTYIFYAIA